MNIPRRQKNHTKKIIIMVIAVAIAILGTYFLYAKLNNTWPFTALSTTTETRDVGEVNYSPPTQKEIEDSQKAKQRGDTENQPKDTISATPGEKVSIPVAISSAVVIGDKLEVRAFTPRIIEGTGECTVTITNGDKIVTAKSVAFIDTSSSICEPIFLDKSMLYSGEWVVSVTYSSPSAHGISQSVTVAIP